MGAGLRGGGAVSDLAELTVAEARRRLARRELSPTDLARACLERIEADGGELGTYLTVTADEALAQAAACDDRLRRGEPVRPLEGIPVAIKDVIVTRGVRTTAGSRMLENFVPPYDATVVERLRAAGAVLLGKTSCDEFAMGSSNENCAFGPCRNPWSRDRVPGGSSGGSAAAVAARQCLAALGSDTGGSIRQPAALCGIVGLKPTYGRVSRYGLIAFASSLDQIGPMTRTVEDAAIVLEAVAGHDPRDSTSAPLPVEPYAERLQCEMRGRRIGVPREYFVHGVDPQVRARVDAALAELRRLGAEIEEVSLPHTEYALAAYYLVATAEASSNLARYDGMRFGYRAPNAGGLFETYARTRAEGFGAEVKRRIMLGTYALSAGYYDAYYLKAQKVRTLIRQDFARALERCELLATPTSPTTAFRLGERTRNPLQMYLSDIFTLAANLAGLPALSVPCGFDDDGLPVGLQFIAPPFQEGRLLAAAHVYEQAAGWYRHRPPAKSEATS